MSSCKYFVFSICFLAFCLQVTPVQSAVLPSGGAMTGSLPAGGIHTHGFKAKAGETIVLSAQSNIATDIAIYNPDGTLLGNGESYFRSERLYQNGTYRVEIGPSSSTDGGDYTLHYFNSNTANEKGALTLKRPRKGLLTSYDIDSFTFAAKAGETIILSAESNLGTEILVFHPDGSPLGNAARNYFQSEVLSQNGTYRVLIKPFFPDDSGKYKFHYFNSRQSNESKLLKSNGMHEGELKNNYDVDRYVFIANAGDTIALLAESSFSTDISVFNPDGTLLSNGESRLWIEKLYQSGTYRVLMRPYNLEHYDTYKLHYFNSRTSKVSKVLSNKHAREGSLASYDLDSYAFEAKAGETIILSAQSDRATNIVIFQPDGSLLGSGKSYFRSGRLAQSGVYHMLIEPFFWGDKENYVLHYFNSKKSNELGSLDKQRNKSRSLSAYDLDSYVFTADFGQIINLTAQSSLTTYLSVFNPDGSLLGNGSGSFQSQRLYQSGTYRVMIRPGSLDQSGTYTLDYVADR